jgi:Succinylglutamate desuccinylase / Aspartoacylase family
MSDDQGRDSLNRRDFMVTAIGASATLAANTDAASAQPAIAAGGTVYTGDMIDGKKVISALNIDDLESGKKHLLYFQGVQMPSGQHWYVSVTVAKGAKPGKRVILVSGVHGDEMSSVHTVQTVMNQLDPGEMSGTVMAVTDVSSPALEGMQRRWPNQGRGIDLIDIYSSVVSIKRAKTLAYRALAALGAVVLYFATGLLLYLWNDTSWRTEIAHISSDASPFCADAVQRLLGGLSDCAS